MKHNFKNYLKLGILLFGISFVLVNCQKDDYQNNIENNYPEEEIKSFFITNKQIPSHILGFVKEKTNNTLTVSVSNRSVKLSQTDAFSRETPLGIVQTNKVVQVYNEKNTKYTFKVTDPTNPYSTINLIVVDTGTEIIEYFIRYIFDANNPPLTLNSGAIDMNTFTGFILFYDYQGVEIGEYVLSNGTSISISGLTNPCPEDEETTDDDDDTTGGPGGTNVGDGSSTGGGGYYENEGCAEGLSWSYGDCGCGLQYADGHAPTGNPCCSGSPLTITDPCTGETWNYSSAGTTAGRQTPCDGDVGVIINSKSHQKNCDKLQALLNTTSIKIKIQELKNDLPPESDENANEKGFVLATDSNGGLVGGNVVSGSTGEFNFIPYDNVVGGGHFHPNDFYPMFSFADLAVLNKIYGSYTNNGEALETSDPVLILVTPPNSSPKVYAIKIKSLALLAIFAGSLTEDKIKEYKISMSNKYRHVQNSIGGESPAKYQKALLEFINTPNLGISLYQANDDLTGWTEKQLSDDGNTVEDNNCN